MKYFSLILLLFMLLPPLTTSAMEKLGKKGLKEITAQSGIDDPNNPEANFPESNIENIKSNTPNNLNNNLQNKDMVIKRGAGVSILIDDVVLLFKSFRDVTYWDTDGV